MTKNQEAMLENNLMKGDSMNYMTNGENASKVKTKNRKSQLKNDDLMARFLKTHPNKHANDEVPNKNDSFGTQPLIKKVCALE